MTIGGFEPKTWTPVLDILPSSKTTRWAPTASTAASCGGTSTTSRNFRRSPAGVANGKQPSASRSCSSLPVTARGTYRGKSCTAGPLTAVVMDLRHYHKYRTYDDDPWEMHYVRFDGPGVANTLSALTNIAGSPVLPYASIPKMEAHFNALYQLLKEQPPGHDAWTWHHLTGLIALIVEAMRRGGNLPPGGLLENTAQGVASALNYLRGYHQRRPFQSTTWRARRSYEAAITSRGVSSRRRPASRRWSTSKTSASAAPRT